MTPQEAAEAMLSPATELLGPIPGRATYRLVVNGCVVPYVFLYQEPERAPYDWTIVVDDRWAADVTHDEVMRWGYIFAQAMAVAAGYNYCGPDSQRVSPFARQVGFLSEEVIDGK